jgi:hypothetical protein
MWLLVLGVLICAVFIRASQALGEETSASEKSGRGQPMFVISPLIGFDNNTLQSRDNRGQPVELEDTGLEYGLFGLFTTKHFVVNNFLFFADVNDADVSGNVFFANYYYNPDSRVTLNLGLGYVYNKIDLESTEITVKAPLPKIGLRIGIPEYGMYLNPYLAWTSEDIETTLQMPAMQWPPGGPPPIVETRIEETEEALLYGLTAGWHWRFLGATAKYYYQDVRGSSDSYHVFRIRSHMFFSKNFGVVARFEYMEQSMTENISFLVGPALIF